MSGRGYAVPQGSDTPLVSVIVPVYNVEDYLPGCLGSILAQTHTRLEVIVVDDGSTDGSAALADDAARTDARVTVIHRANGGLSAARNTGIDAAHGDYLGFVDGDDRIAPTMVERLLGTARRHGCALAVCAIRYVFPDGTGTTRAPGGPERVFGFGHAMREMNDYRLFDMSACTKLYRRDLLDGVRFPEGRLSEDLFVMPRIIERAGRVAYVPEGLYDYVQRPGSITRSAAINHDFLDAARAQMDFLDRRHPGLTAVGHAAYASAALTVYDAYLKNRVPCPDGFRRRCRAIVRDNLAYIRAGRPALAKRVQFRLFLTSTRLYDIVFLLYRRRWRV